MPDLHHDFLLCRECGADTADSSYLYNIFSPLALVQSNQSLFGRRSVPVQFLENPLGIRFRVVTISKASCTGVDQWQSDFSWFPGYAWKFCLCTHCGHHLGWLFEPLKSANEDQRTVSKNGFYAIILDNVLSESSVELNTTSALANYATEAGVRKKNESN
uniref:CULT domain-containing protein n=1 Tax=Timema shepardi TaxID=629360 RepID=A0A7R9AZN7_TIMSH|nr:unnamed protein product [Timema shepardi]